MRNLLSNRILAAALVVAGLAALASCSNDDSTANLADLVHPTNDNEVFTALVAANNTRYQQAAQELAAGADADTMAYAQTEQTDHGATLNRLVGSQDINPTDTGAPAPGGLATSANLQLTPSALSVKFNSEGTEDTAALTAGDVPTDCAYLTNEQARHQELLDNVTYFLDPQNDGGAVITNDQLKAELTQEKAQLEDHLNKVTTLLDTLSQPGDATAGTADGLCYVAP